MKECTSMFGHKYEARYDSRMPDKFEVEGNYIEAIEAIKTKTYIHDICTRCGHIIGGNKLDAERGEG